VNEELKEIEQRVEQAAKTYNVFLAALGLSPV